jgi:5-methylcytosine-specific restriction protein A
LIPLENISNEIELKGMPEGAKMKVEVNKYERDKKNRATCISFLGVDCKVCGLNFFEKYGELGKDYIHVHHIIPISKMVPEYIVNPLKDLIPVCPNCHAMLHRKDPPLSIDELRQLLNMKANP